jgi:hypothetical protein
METIPEALQKLASLGDVQHIRLHLASLGLTAVRGQPATCIIAAYLHHELQDDREILVHPCRPNARNWMQHPLSPCVKDHGKVTPLPGVLNDLANAFDFGSFPELEASSLPELVR